MTEEVQPSSDEADKHSAASSRKRLKPGERRIQILQALAGMLEAPQKERITTAALARRIGVSEAALYRHFASKAKMFEALIEFIESTTFTLFNKLKESEENPRTRVFRMVGVLLQFSEKNPGMTRVMAGGALVIEHERLQQRMNVFFDRVEMYLKDALFELAEQNGSPTPGVEAQARARMLTAYALGQMQRFVHSGFRTAPTEHLQPCLETMVG